MSNLYVVTVATHNDYYLPYLKKTCEIYGSKLIVLGYGEKWKGFRWRQKIVLNYLKTLKNDDIVCFVDGFDVICIRNLNEFKNVFIKLTNKYNSKIIVSEHKMIINNDILSYLNYYFVKMYFDECKKISLNAGSYVAYVKNLIEIFENINNISNNDEDDDQVILTKYCKLHPNDMYIDVNAEIFLTVCNPYKNIDNILVFNNNKIYYKGNQPFFIHAAGETYLDNILIKMNIDYNDNICDKLYQDIYKKKIFRLKNTPILYLLIYIFIFIIFIILIYHIIKFFIKKSKVKKSYKIK
jgi:predicted nucleic acid-binding Zn ribbon protein